MDGERIHMERRSEVGVRGRRGVRSKMDQGFARAKATGVEPRREVVGERR